MARNVVKKGAAAEGGEDEGAEDALAQGEGGAPTEGGSLGVPTTDSGAQLNPSHTITRPGDAITADVRDAKSEQAKPPKRYEVLNGGKVIWHNQAYVIRPGQVLSENSHDVAGFKRQGIRMQELPDEEQAAAG
jgi:hypothetical protein